MIEDAEKFKQEDEGITRLDNNKEAPTERYEELIKEFGEKLGLFNNTE